MPSPAHTPRHSRQSSVADSISPSPNERRQSKSSNNDVRTPFRHSLSNQDTFDISIVGSGGPRFNNGMGNLADELADAFSDSGDEDEIQINNAKYTKSQRDLEASDQYSRESSHVSIGSETLASNNNPGLLASDRRETETKGSCYDGSEYASGSDYEAGELTPGLLAKIDAVESLVRRGTENYGGAADDVFKRVTDGLRDLGSQSSVEGNASRLITAHSALTTHLAHQTRRLQSLAFPLLSPLAPPPGLDIIDDLIPLVVSLSEDMPRPSTVAYNSLATLHSMTSELLQTLSYLSDSLNMSRQTTATATRRLKSARELVAEIRQDEELREQGERWLSRGNWGERLQSRECAGICGEVIGGFEAFCNGWRERLLSQGESKA